MDMLHGPLLKKILIFAFPIIMGSILQQLFSAVDIAVVGLTGDSNGQAAMAAALVLTNIVNYIFIGAEHFFVGLFTPDAAVAEYTYLRFKVVLAVQCLICSYEISGSVLRGFGRSMLPAVITIFGTCVLRIVWVNTVCAHVKNIAYVFVVYPVSWVMTGLFVVGAFVVVYRKVAK